jgi:hypothetical protein
LINHEVDTNGYEQASMLQWRTAADKNIGKSQNHRSHPNLNLSLLAIFGQLDTPEGVKANVRAIWQILDQVGRRDYTVKVYPSAAHNLMEVPRDSPNEYVRLKRFPPGLFETMVDWTTSQLRRRASGRRLFAVDRGTVALRR